ncbi:MAG: hypothetical protein HC768_17455 [Acaryochloris sp. CRU_2_0]|nr:hypothetical protein [Acaryochloris sp. CRU_2_0]
MLTKVTDSGKPPGGEQALQDFVYPDPQVIEEYREIYLQIAIKVQSLMSMGVAYTYDKLYKLGCDHPPLSYRIDVLVSYELQVGGYSKSDQVNILFYGPYIQSQMLDHHLSESGAKSYIRQRLCLGPKPPLRQPNLASGSAA